MASELIWHRSEILGTQVITRSTGKRLGVVSELLVDVDRREVVALGLRDSTVARVLPGLSLTTYMYLDAVQQVGDVVLVEDSDVIEDIDPEEYSTLINSEVITENNDPLGRVRGYKFNLETGEVEALIIATVGISAVPDPLLSTYELPIEEISSTGPNRIIVFEGSEDRLVQLTVGVMEKLGLGVAPWERDDEEEYIIPTTPAENQLGTGEPLRTPAYSQPYRQPAVQQQRAPQRINQWEEDNWNEPEPELVPRTMPQPQEQHRRYYEPDPQGGYPPDPRSAGYAPGYPPDYPANSAAPDYRSGYGSAPEPSRDPYGDRRADRYDRAPAPRYPESRYAEPSYSEPSYPESRYSAPSYPESRYSDRSPTRSPEPSRPPVSDRGDRAVDQPGNRAFDRPPERTPEPARREPSRPAADTYRTPEPTTPPAASSTAVSSDTGYNNYFDDEDVWADTPSPTPYQAPLQLPEKQPEKQPEKHPEKQPQRQYEYED